VTFGGLSGAGCPGALPSEHDPPPDLGRAQQLPRVKRLTRWLRRLGGGRVRALPAAGRAVILSDLHGHVDDFEAALAVTGVVERIAAGEDAYLVVLGDVPDVLRHQAVDETVPDAGDTQILDRLLELRASLGERADRVVYVEGNHDFHILRICGEVARFHAHHGGPPVRRGPTAPVTPEALAAYCEYYRGAYGEEVFAANMAPYDMVPRATAEHLALLEAAPVLLELGASRVLVAHAGPARMERWRERPGALRTALAASDREDLRRLPPAAYYETPYHQVLNGRYRAGDYDLADLRAFLEAFGAAVLVTGHTPLPYLLDIPAGGPSEGCAFQSGVGVIGDAQLVLCSSFGAFTPAWKRVLEVDLATPLASAAQLLAAPGAVVPLYDAAACAEHPARPLPGADLVAPG